MKLQWRLSSIDDDKETTPQRPQGARGTTRYASPKNDKDIALTRKALVPTKTLNDTEW